MQTCNFLAAGFGAGKESQTPSETQTTQETQTPATEDEPQSQIALCPNDFPHFIG